MEQPDPGFGYFPPRAQPGGQGNGAPVTGARGDTVEFARQVRLSDQELDLPRAALGVAAAFNSGLDIEIYIHELDLLAEALSQRAASSSEAMRTRATRT